MKTSRNHEVGRPGDGFLAEHSRRAALSAPQQGTGEKAMVERGHGQNGSAGSLTGVGQDWRARAICREVDPELFFPVAERGPNTAKQVAAAKAVCAGCPVREACLEWAVDALATGIAGGATTAERRHLRGERSERSIRTRPPVTDLAGRPEPPPGAKRAEIAACGRAALGAGEPTVSVARRLGVTVRTVERWASTPPASAIAASGGA